MMTSNNLYNNTNKKLEKVSKNKEFGGNWDEVMSKSMKKLPLVQREKETYRQEVLKKKELDLKTKESKGEVFKFESLVENKSSKKDFNKLKEKKSKITFSIKKVDSNVLAEMENKSCMNCDLELANGDSFKIYLCGHILHDVSRIFYF